MCGSEVATPHCEHSKAVEPGKKDNAGHVRCILICIVSLGLAKSTTSTRQKVKLPVGDSASPGMAAYTLGTQAYIMIRKKHYDFSLLAYSLLRMIVVALILLVLTFVCNLSIIMITIPIKTCACYYIYYY